MCNTILEFKSILLGWNSEDGMIFFFCFLGGSDDVLNLGGESNNLGQN